MCSLSFPKDSLLNYLLFALLFTVFVSHWLWRVLPLTWLFLLHTSAFSLRQCLSCFHQNISSEILQGHYRMPGYNFPLKKKFHLRCMPLNPRRLSVLMSSMSSAFAPSNISSLSSLPFWNSKNSFSFIIALSHCPSCLCVWRSTFLQIWTLTCNLYAQLLHKSGIDVPLLYSLLHLELKRAQPTSLARMS